MKIFKNIKYWWFNKDSLLARIFPTGTVISLLWDRFESLKSRDYREFIAIFLMSMILAFILILLPSAMLETENKNENGKPMFYNGNVLAAEIFLFVMFIFEIIER